MACHDKYWGHKLKTHKIYGVQKFMDCNENLWHLVAKWHAMYHHMEDRIDKGQQYFQLVNKWNSFIKSMRWIMMLANSHASLLAYNKPCYHGILNQY